MKQQLVRCLYVAAGMLVLPVAASAQSQAFTNSTVNVRAGARRGSRYGDGLYQRVSVVRCRRAESARLGVCVTAQFALSGQQCAIDELRHGARAADPRIFDRRLLGQLLSWPPLVQPAIPLGTPSAAATASSGRGAATGRPLSAGRATAAGSSGRTTSGWAATGECGRTTAGRAATG
jgi:hypothetical protein